MDEDSENDLDFLNEHWKSLFIQNGREIAELKDFLRECLGEHKGGLLFIGCGREEGNRLVLKLDLDGHLYKRISNTGDDDEDWEWIGDISDGESPPYL